MVTQAGQPVECFLTPGSFGDVDALKYYAYALPDNSIIYADKAYNDYEIEDCLQEVEHITLLPMRKKNSKRALPTESSFVGSVLDVEMDCDGWPPEPGLDRVQKPGVSQDVPRRPGSTWAEGAERPTRAHRLRPPAVPV